MSGFSGEMPPIEPGARSLEDGTVLASADVGEFAEGMPWQIVEGRLIEADQAPCPHCVRVAPDVARKIKGVLRHKRRSTYFMCMRTVEARNEGGFNATFVCLECILEEVKKLAPPRT